MERCNTCPHWGLAENEVMLTALPGYERVCVLTVTAYNTPFSGRAAFASSDSGDRAGLYTRADFGCTEHPGNR